MYKEKRHMQQKVCQLPLPSMVTQDGCCCPRPPPHLQQQPCVTAVQGCFKRPREQMQQSQATPAAQHTRGTRVRQPGATLSSNPSYLRLPVHSPSHTPSTSHTGEAADQACVQTWKAGGPHTCIAVARGMDVGWSNFQACWHLCELAF